MVHSDGVLAKAEDASLIVRRAINFARPNTSETPTWQKKKKKVPSIYPRILKIRKEGYFTARQICNGRHALFEAGINDTALIKVQTVKKLP